jgi:DNA-binding transcriptional ArsR family regulator
MARSSFRDKPAFPSVELAERVADTLFALSTPSRVQILGCLMDGPRSVSELVEALAMEQSAVSHQLRILREQGLVAVERVGRRSMYALTDEHVLALMEEALRHSERRSSQGLSFPLRIRRRSRGQAESG